MSFLKISTHTTFFEICFDKQADSKNAGLTAKQVSNGQVIGSLQVHVEHMCSLLWSRRSCGRCQMCAHEPTPANLARFKEELLPGA